jgi:hypothetical protein
MSTAAAAAAHSLAEKHLSGMLAALELKAKYDPRTPMGAAPLGADPSDYGVENPALIVETSKTIYDDEGEAKEVVQRRLSPEFIAEYNRMSEDLSKMTTVMRNDLKPSEFWTTSLNGGDKARGIGVYKLVAAVALPWCAIATSSVAAERFFAKMRLMEQANRLQRKISTWQDECMCVGNHWLVEKNFEKVCKEIPSDLGKPEA